MNWKVRESTYPLSSYPERLRPTAAIDRVGVGNVTDADLLACVVTGNKKHNAVDVATGLLQSCSLHELSSMSIDALATCPGMTKRQAVRLAAAIEIGRRTLQPADPRVLVRTPADVLTVVKAQLDCRQEVFRVLLLDAKSRLIRCETVTTGLVDASLVHPREIFRSAIDTNAAAIVLCHNHPSGDPAPSAEDIRITRQLIEAGKIVDIKVLDHVVVAVPDRGRAFVSFREEGLLQF